MELDFNQEQAQIKEAVRRFLARECPPALVRTLREQGSGLPKAIWHKMAELGWLGLPFAADYGGSESDWVTVAAVCEELGWACDPTSFVDCIISCGWLIQDIASEEQKKRWLVPLIRGELRLSLAILEEELNWDVDACRTLLRESDRSLCISGQKMFVQNAADSDFLVVTVQDKGQLRLVLISPRAAGVELIKLRSLAHPNLYQVTFNNVLIAPEQLLGDAPDASAALACAIRRTSAFDSVIAAGGAQRVLEMAVAYSKERQQFGKPIGSFQAVQHMLANAWMDVETAWLAAYEAITCLELGLPADDKVAVAKCVSNEAFTKTCFTAHQVFGGMGYMWETDLHLWTRKAKEIELACGGLHRSRRQLAEFL